MFNRIKGRVRHLSRRYRYSFIAVGVLSSTALGLRELLINDGNLVMIYLLTALMLLFICILCFSIIKDVKKYKQQIAAVDNYRKQINQIRRLKAENQKIIEQHSSKIRGIQKKMD
tara:strand:+ start:111307 stop:111651 length:345 start_codon:yes stop_codon:yes gene_type:complete